MYLTLVRLREDSERAREMVCRAAGRRSVTPFRPGDERVPEYLHTFDAHLVIEHSPDEPYEMVRWVLFELREMEVVEETRTVVDGL